MNYYDQQLQELLAQCARKRKLEASAAELLRQRDKMCIRDRLRGNLIRV